MTGLLIIATLVSIAYPVYAIYKMGKIPNSLTCTYSELGYLYHFALLVMSLCVLPIWVDYSFWYTTPLALISCVGIVLTTHQQDGKIHRYIVIASCVSAILWLMLNGLHIINSVYAVVIILFIILSKNWVFFAELAIIYCVINTLWIS